MPGDERYEVQDPDKERALRTLATLMNDETPDGMGFAVFLFDYGPGGSMFYLSTAQRADVVAAIKEWIAREEAKMTTGETHDHQRRDTTARRRAGH